MQNILSIGTPKKLDVPKLNCEAILTSFINSVIKNEVKSLIRKYRNKFEFVEYRDELYGYKCYITYDTELLNPNTVESELLSKSLDLLSERELSILNYYLQGYTDKEISKYLNLSRQTVNKIRLKTFAKVKCSLLLGGFHV